MERIIPSDQSVKLEGFNNLTKALSFNIYDFCTASSPEERLAYVEYINKNYNAEKITNVLKGVCDIIEANVLAVSDQDYEPWGASSLVLMSDLKCGQENLNDHLKEAIKSQKGSVNFHLDKSHICAHTYPDFRSQGEVCSVRLDIDIATCGDISPLKALNFMFDHFDSDVVVIDYVVRGFTRDQSGRRVYMDHPLRSIQDYIDPKILGDYHCLDLALQRDNIWQTKMLRTNLNITDYFIKDAFVSDEEIERRMNLVRSEMHGVLHMFPDN